MTIATTSLAPMLAAYLRGHLGRDPQWALALDRLDASAVRLHLAVMSVPYLSLLLSGDKTMESRFSRVRCAPWGALDPGDVVALKKTGGPVTGAFIAGRVLSIPLDPHDPGQIGAIRDQHGAAICARGDQFWADRADTTMATLAEVTAARALPGLPFPKKDRRGWVVLTSLAASTTPASGVASRQAELPWAT